MVPLPSLEEMKVAHRLLAEYSYELQPVERGYANRTLYINLDNNSFVERPVTIDEYKSRADRFDTLLHKIIGLYPENLSIKEKIAYLRQYREEQYEGLLDAVYKRRGWDMNSIPTIEKVRELGIDLPEVTEVINQAIMM